jgi:hypothetical protein
MTPDDAQIQPSPVDLTPYRTARIDSSVPHIARVYDYWLGGKDNFAADRQAGDATIDAFPGIVRSVKTNRAFLARSVGCFATELGIRQFLDVGTGIPTANNTHEVAQSIAPESRIVYVDNDPIVLAHAEALLKSTPEGACAYVDCDMREPGRILVEAARTLDFHHPIGVMLIGILHFAGSQRDTRQIIRTLMEAAPRGSAVAISHPASDLHAAEVAEMIRRLNTVLKEQTTLRNRDEVEALLAGYELLPPGVVPAAAWRPGPDDDQDAPSAVWAAAAVKR